MVTNQTRLVGMAYYKPLENCGEVLKVSLHNNRVSSLLFTEATLSDGNRNL